MQRVRSRFNAVRFPKVVRAAAGPVALAVFALTQFVGTSPYGWGGALWVALFGLGAGVALIVRRRLTTTQVMALEVLACSLVKDGGFSTWGVLRDLGLYLHAGTQFLAGAPVYTTVAMDHYPYGGNLPFLYAPPTVPVFAALSALPFWLVGSVWLGASVAAILLSLRIFGLSWKWALLALLWPPIEEGLFVGNVAIPSLLLLALAPRLGGLLGLGTMLKPQNGIVWLWLLRERRWRSLAFSVALVAGVVAISLPITGVGLWSEWIRGLSAYERSQEIVPNFYGIGLGRWVPLWMLVPLALAVVGVALVPRGRKGLARLGVASVVASPSLWSHGFILAIPEFLRLRGQWFWMAAGLCAGGRWPGPQAAIGLAVAGWFVGPRIHRATHRFMPRASADIDTAIHPLGRRAREVPAPRELAFQPAPVLSEP